MSQELSDLTDAEHVRNRIDDLLNRCGEDLGMTLLVEEIVAAARADRRRWMEHAELAVNEPDTEVQHARLSTYHPGCFAFIRLEAPCAVQVHRVFGELPLPESHPLEDDTAQREALGFPVEVDESVPPEVFEMRTDTEVLSVHTGEGKFVSLDADIERFAARAQRGETHDGQRFFVTASGVHRACYTLPLGDRAWLDVPASGKLEITDLVHERLRGLTSH